MSILTTWGNNHTLARLSVSTHVSTTHKIKCISFGSISEELSEIFCIQLYSCNVFAVKRFAIIRYTMIMMYLNGLPWKACWYKLSSSWNALFKNLYSKKSLHGNNSIRTICPAINKSFPRKTVHQKLQVHMEFGESQKEFLHMLCWLSLHNISIHY